MLTKLVDKFGIPFVTTQLGKGVIDERHPLFMGLRCIVRRGLCAPGDWKLRT